MSFFTLPLSRRDWQWFAVGAVLSLAHFGLYYGAGWHRSEDTSLLIMYRPGAGDRDYLPLARQFASGQFGDGFTAGKIGEGTVGFPCFSVLPHGLALRWIGPVGFALVDILVPCLHFALGARFLMAAGALPRVALAVALFVTLGGLGSLAQLLVALFGYSLHGVPFYLQFLQTWEFRFPRNFLTELYVLGALAQWVALARAGLVLRNSWWIATAAWMAAVLQSDVYSFLALALAFGAVGALQLFRRNAPSLREIAWRCLLLIGVGLFLALPFLLQRTHVTADVLERYGVFRVPRREVGHLTQIAFAFFPRTFVLVTLVLPWLAWASAGGLRQRELFPTRVAIALGALQIAGLCAMPFLIGVSTLAVQLYHFRDAARSLLAWSVLASYALTLSSLARFFSRAWKLTRPALHHAAGVAAVALLSALLWPCYVRAQHHLANPSAPRLVDTVPLPFTRSYHADFAALSRELDQPSYAAARVLGTVDADLYAWWTGLRGRPSFLGHAFVSALPTHDLFARVARFARLNQIAPDGFVPWMMEPTMNEVHSLWFSGDRYQASPLHTFADAADYSAAERASTATVHPVDCWKLIVPERERRRLAAGYATLSEATDAPFSSPDLIVLTHEFPQLRPDPRRFRLAYENPTFRVFQLQSPVAR